MYGMFSVGWVVALASFQALFQFKTTFMRTPKTTGDARVANGLFATQWEAGIGLPVPGLGASILALADRTPNTLFIGGLLLLQSSLYLHIPDLRHVL